MSYARFLPEAWQARVASADHEMWDWRGHRIHIARRRDPDARIRVLVVHGAGGSTEVLWPVASAVAGSVDLAAVDLPLYGRTVARDPGAVRYDDWLDALVDLIAREDDGRPLLLFGASIGGMLAVEVAERSGRVAHVVATCLLDPGRRDAREAMMRLSWLGRWAPQLVRGIVGPLARLRVPVGWLAPLRLMSRDPALAQAIAEDPRAGGVRIPLGFLRSFIERPAVRASVPVLLAHPAADEWTPAALSEATLARFDGPTASVLLQNCGHFPIEEPGLAQLADEVRMLVAELGR